MMPADKIHALVPVFNWSWWQIFMVTLILDWGIFHILKWLDPPRRKSVHWWTNVYGDIFLPIGIASSTVILRNFSHAESWYSSRLWNWVVLILGAFTVFLVEFVVVFKLQRRKTRHQELSPSNLWHALIFVPMFYVSVIPLIPMFVTHHPGWAFFLAIIGYGGWLLTLIHDNIWPPENKPVNFLTWLKDVIETS
jgi:hypothetical protein